MLSVVIPSYKDPLLQKTIDSLLENAEGEIEIIAVLDGYWPNQPLKDDKRVRIVHLGKNRGMRGAINAGVEVARGEFLMRTDEHAVFGKGYDVILARDSQPNWIITPRRYFLDPVKWEVMDIPPVDYMKLKIVSYGRGHKFSGVDWPRRAAERKDIMIDETMAMQGSCWFMPHKWWNEVIGELQSEGYDTHYQDSHEMVFKTWKAGGKLMVDKNTWHAHKHRKFPRTHGYGGEKADKCFVYALSVWRDYFEKEIKPEWDARENKKNSENRLGEYRVDNPTMPDGDYYGFKFRVRRHFYDKNTIKRIFCEDPYRMSDKPKVVIDIGAHIGAFSLLAVRAGAEVVYAFEPEKYNFETLRYNIEINGCQDKVRCINKGVGVPGETKLYVHTRTSSGPTAYLTADIGFNSDRYQMASFVSIRSVFDDYRIERCDLLKINCEGSEKDIIGEIDADLAGRIGQISVEIHDQKLKEELVDKLSQWYKAESVGIKKRNWVFSKPKKILLHIGCANRYYEGFINSDSRTEWKGKKHRLDMVMDISKHWPYADESVDGIVSMHVLQQLTWRGLLVAFKESYRVLKKGGVMRFGCPMVEIKDKELDYLLGWNNINLFSFDLLKKILVDRIGFSSIKEMEYQRSAMPELAKIDNRPNRGTMYFEAIK